MPKRKCDDVDDMRNLAIRSGEAERRLQKKRVMLAVKNCPSVLYHFSRTMAAHGYTDEYIATPEDVACSFQTQAISSRADKKRADENEGNNQLLAQGVQQEDIVPNNDWSLDALSRNNFRDRILPGIEPNNFKAAALRATVDKLGLAQAKEEYIRMACFVTGWPTNWGLTGNYRNFENIRKEGWSRSLSRGRRGLAIGLPTNWPDEGLIVLFLDESVPDHVMAKQRFTLITISVPFSALPIFDPAQFEKQLWVDANWSEHEATIHSRHPDAKPEDGYSLKNVFANTHTDFSKNQHHLGLQMKKEEKTEETKQEAKTDRMAEPVRAEAVECVRDTSSRSPIVKCEVKEAECDESAPVFAEKVSSDEELETQLSALAKQTEGVASQVAPQAEAVGAQAGGANDWGVAEYDDYMLPPPKVDVKNE